MQSRQQARHFNHLRSPMGYEALALMKTRVVKCQSSAVLEWRIKITFLWLRGPTACILQQLCIPFSIPRLGKSGSDPPWTHHVHSELITSAVVTDMVPMYSIEAQSYCSCYSVCHCCGHMQEIGLTEQARIPWINEVTRDINTDN